MTKRKWLVLSLLVLGLVACESEQDKKLEESIIESNAERYMQSDEDKIAVLLEKSTLYAEEVHVNVLTDKFSEAGKSKYVDASTEYLNYINSVNPYDLGLTNKVLEDYVSDFDYHMTMYAEYILKYLHTGEKVHKDMARDYFDEVRVDLDLMGSLIN